MTELQSFNCSVLDTGGFIQLTEFFMGIKKPGVLWRSNPELHLNGLFILESRFTGHRPSSRTLGFNQSGNVRVSRAQSSWIVCQFIFGMCVCLLL